MSFGLRPNVEPLPSVYWGARVIFHPPDGIDILWDRQQFNENDGTNKEARETLWKWIQEKGLPRLRKELRNQRITQRDHILVTVIDRRYTIIANPNASYGYLYLGAWQNDTSRIRTPAEPL